MLPDEPFSDKASWKEVLQQVAVSPLELCPNFPQIATRHEAWWNCANTGGPLLVAAVNTDRTHPISRRLDLLDNTEAWFDERYRMMCQYFYSTDAFPFLRVDLGPVSLGGMLGAKVDFVSDTTWTHAFIEDDWSNVPQWQIDPANRFWEAANRLLARVAEDAAGRYICCTPSLGGSGDVLLNLRDSEKLAMDVLDQPQKVQTALGLLYPVWEFAFTRLYQIATQRNAGLIHWLQMWSNEPYIVGECDFNYMIGPRPFRSLFLPDLARQAAAVGRMIFHLDGPGATRHIDGLLEIPEMRAIQYVAGAGHSALEYVDILRKIQSKGRALQVSVSTVRDILPLAEVLDPAGLAFLCYDFETAEDIQEMQKKLAAI